MTVWHDEVAYVFPNEERIFAENTLRTTNWKTINASIDAEVSGQLFLLGIDHGRSPENGSYIYRVHPGIDRAKAAEISTDSRLVVVSNTPDMQAVWDSELQMLQAVFYTAGAIVHSGLAVDVAQPCLVLLDQKSGRLHVSDPSRNFPQLSVTVDGQAYSFDVANGKTASTKLVDGPQKRKAR